jgi:hypothetical protein
MSPDAGGDLCLAWRSFPRVKACLFDGDLLLEHPDALEQEAEEKGGMRQVLADHFAKVYKISLPLAAEWHCLVSERLDTTSHGKVLSPPMVNIAN